MQQDMQTLFELTGQVAVVTGGARHLGFDIASALAAAGAKVALTSRTEEKAQAAVRNLQQVYAVEALGLGLDQQDPQAVKDAFARIHRWQGRLDILVNNAGGGSSQGQERFLQRASEDIDRVIRVNLLGMLYCCQAAAQLMTPAGYGKIINIASIAGVVGRDRRVYDRSGMVGQAVEYAAAKAGILGATLDLAAYLGPQGIRVNAISPGGFNGDGRGLSPSFVRDYSAKVPLARMGRDGVDIKGVALFLASSASDYITGENIVVDGGFSKWN